MARVPRVLLAALTLAAAELVVGFAIGQHSSVAQRLAVCAETAVTPRDMHARAP